MQQIIADQHIVFVDEQTSYEVDCSTLLDDGVVFAGIIDKEKWVERRPFTGRITDYDFSTVDQLIADAEQLHVDATQPPSEQEQLENWRQVTVVSAFQARAALTQAGHMADVKAYMAEPDTDEFTILAWETATEFRRDSPTVNELAGVLGLSDNQVDDLFRFALTIHA
ncbi:hypothetical protein [Chromohalobacter israelensis]|uniref:hypothetical protein n=1 Tax=Chromohalobacter israelensis TaxID=141390 RepID=UPI000FFE805D|nr:hypothetical protein [Chromohalobacter salexigens]RXE48695.1 hypothetical protein B4O83_12240 [Chromohalobacter salexigens]